MSKLIAIDALADVTNDSVLHRIKEYVNYPTSANFEHVLTAFCKKNNIDAGDEEKYSKAMLSLIFSESSSVSIAEEDIAKKTWRDWIDDAVHNYIKSITDSRYALYKTNFVRCMIAVKWHRIHKTDSN